ncbi:MAG: hypothetical protein IPH33_12735 [Bacteroidetes bacterium]|nr:hypothetical protein [Bacteroidota bacterium]
MRKIFVIFVLIFFINNISFAQCWTSVTSGAHHNIAIKEDGTLWTWGWNSSGELGDGTNIDKYFPVQIGNSTNWKDVSAGDNFCLAIMKNGTLWSFGNNNFGQLGDGTFNNKNTVTQVGTDSDWVFISCGDAQSSYGIKQNGTLWAWGHNAIGQLGDSTVINKNSPVQVGSDSNWQSVNGGGFYALATKLNGTIWGWGKNNNGQLGDSTNVGKISPIQVGSSTNWKKVSAGFDHAIAIKQNNTLWAGVPVFSEIVQLLEKIIQFKLELILIGLIFMPGAYIH